VRSFTRVTKEMVFEMRFPSEGFRAIRTLVWPFPSVGADVPAKIC